MEWGSGAATTPHSTTWHVASPATSGRWPTRWARSWWVPASSRRSRAWASATSSSTRAGPGRSGGSSTTACFRRTSRATEAPDELAVLLRLAVVPEAGLLEDAVRGARLRQRVGDHGGHPLVRERLGEHRPRGRGRQAAFAPLGGNLVAELDDAAHGRTLEATPADQLRGVSGDEQASSPRRAGRVRGKRVSRVLQRAGEGGPAGHDVVAKRSGERVVAGQCCVDQRQLAADEADHGAEPVTRSRPSSPTLRALRPATSSRSSSPTSSRRQPCTTRTWSPSSPWRSAEISVLSS